MKKFVVLVLIVSLSLPLFSQDTSCEAIVVEGKSSIKLMPEQLIFQINITVKDSIYTKCANLAIEKIETIKKQFTIYGIDEQLIKTQNYSIREVRKHDYKTQKSVFEGFEASIPISIKTKVDNSKNDQIFEIIKNNFEANFNLNFALTTKQIETVKEKLIDLAVEDAKQKAKVITKSAEIKLGKISKIQYGEPRTVRGFSQNYDLMEARTLIGSGSNSKITDVMNPNEIEMRTSIIIAWDIEY